MRASVATKIFSIAFMVIAAMAIVSGVNLISSRNVANGIQRVSVGYLTIYAATARVNVYTMEAAYRTRHFIALKALGLQQEGDDLLTTQHRLEELDRQVKLNLAQAQETTRRELANPDPLVDKARLARIDERLLRIESQEKTHLARQLVVITALDRGDMAEFRERFADLSKWRAEYDTYVDDTRWLVFKAAIDAGGQVARAQARAMRFSVALLVLAGLLAVGTALILSRQLVRPLNDLLVGMRAISSGSLEVQVPVRTNDEVGKLTEAFNAMTQELRVGLRARELFGNYIDARIARQLIEAPQTLGEYGERRIMTVLFCDLQGFTAMSEEMTPRGLVSVMNRHFTLMSEAVRENSGVIDKFIGDAMMAYWGAPFVSEADQDTLAVTSAISQVERMPRLQGELSDLLNMKRGLPQLALRIGIATGEVLVGSIGSDVMRNFTVMGDAVNLAARLEGANKLYGTHILTTEETARRIGEDIVLREVDSLVVVGQTHPARIFEVVGRRSQVSPAVLAAHAAYAKALVAYRNQQWDLAEAGFKDVLDLDPDDGPARLLLDRVTDLRQQPPQTEWDGVWQMATK